MSKNDITSSSPISGNLVVVDVVLDGTIDVTKNLTFASIPLNQSFIANLQLQDYEGNVRTDLNMVYSLYYYEREVGNLFEVPVLFSEGIATFNFAFGIAGIYDLVNTNLQFIDFMNSKNMGFTIDKRQFVNFIYTIYNSVMVSLTPLQVAGLVQSYLNKYFPAVGNVPLSGMTNMLSQYIGTINIIPLSVYIS